MTYPSSNPSLTPTLTDALAVRTYIEDVVRSIAPELLPQLASFLAQYPTITQNVSGVISGAAYGVDAANTPSKNATALQSAMDENDSPGALLLLPARTINTLPLIYRNNIHFKGVRDGLSRLKLDDGVNADLIQSDGFTGLTGTNPSAWSGVKKASFSDLMLDGNRANNSSGRGLAFYGYDLDFNRVTIHDCAGMGLWTEMSDSFQIENVQNSSGFIMYADRLKIFNCNDDGLHMLGPHDSIISRSVIWKNGRKTANSANLRATGRPIGTGGAYGLQLHQSHIYSGGATGGDGRSANFASDYGLWADVPVYVIGTQLESCRKAAVYLTGDETHFTGGAGNSILAGCQIYGCNGTVASDGFDGRGATFDGTNPLTAVQTMGCKWTDNRYGMEFIGTNGSQYHQGYINAGAGQQTVLGTPVNNPSVTWLMNETGAGTLYQPSFQVTNTLGLPSVTGSRGANAALASVLTVLANAGLITDNTTP